MRGEQTKIIDIKEMPGFNPVVKNGIDSVSKGIIFLEVYQPEKFWADGDYSEFKDEGYPKSELDEKMKLGEVTEAEINEWEKQNLICFVPHCKTHGAINKVSREGIWRCLACGEGAYEVKENVLP